MITFACHVCQTALSVGDEFAGQLVRCPVCRTAVKAPAPAEVSQAPLPAAGETPQSGSASSSSSAPPASSLPRQTIKLPPHLPPSGPSRRFGFPCCYCSSHLEATTDASGSEGTCPTCGSSIIVPLLGRNGQLIDPLTQQVIKPDPHPVHAYAAAGDRAPAITKDVNGNRIIRCPRCRATNAISANLCAKCGVPFTMEGAEGVGAATAYNGMAVSSLILGILSVPLFFLFVPAIAALGLGVAAIIRNSRSGGGGVGMAIAGIIGGIIGLLIALNVML